MVVFVLNAQSLYRYKSVEVSNSSNSPVMVLITKVFAGAPTTSTSLTSLKKFSGLAKITEFLSGALKPPRPSTLPTPRERADDVDFGMIGRVLPKPNTSCDVCGLWCK